MKTRFIIICAGKQSRWNNHLNTSKHLLNIDGEIMLNRTVRLIKKYFQDETIVVVSNERDGYLFDGVGLYTPRLNDKNLGLDKFLSSEGMWREDCRNIILYGDVWFSDNFMKLLSVNIQRDWYLYARYMNSYIFDKGGECFAFSFYHEHFELFINAMYSLIQKCQDIEPAAVGGWMLYRELEGYHYLDHKIGKHIIEINDLTEDFDYPEDFDNWLIYYKKLKEQYLDIEL